MTMYGEENLNTNVEESTDEQQYKKLKKFNFGAFAFGGIWGLLNGVYKPSYFWFLCFALGIFPLKFVIFVIGLFVLSIIFGIKGNEWSYNDKDWKTFEQFEKTQKKWNIAGLCLFVFQVIFITIPFLISLGILGSYVSKAKNSPTTLVSTPLVLTIVNDDSFKNAASSEELTDLFFKEMNNAQQRQGYDGYKYSKYKHKKYTLLGSKDGKQFLLTFKKSKVCSLKAENCSIAVYFYDGRKLLEKGITYYDNAGKTKNVNLMKK